MIKVKSALLTIDSQQGRFYFGCYCAAVAGFISDGKALW